MREVKPPATEQVFASGEQVLARQLRSLEMVAGFLTRLNLTKVAAEAPRRRAQTEER